MDPFDDFEQADELQYDDYGDPSYEQFAFDLYDDDHDYFDDNDNPEDNYTLV